jgi:hypothetical protein
LPRRERRGYPRGVANFRIDTVGHITTGSHADSFIYITVGRLFPGEAADDGPDERYTTRQGEGRSPDWERERREAFEGVGYLVCRNRAGDFSDMTWKSGPMDSEQVERHMEREGWLIEWLDEPAPGPFR